MKIKILPAIALILVLFGSCFLAGYINGHRKGDRASETLLHAKDSMILTYSTTIHGLEVSVAEKEQEVLSQREAIKADAIYREELRKLNLKQANELTRLQLTINTLLKDVAHNGQIIDVPVKQDLTNNAESIKQNAILLPFEFHHEDQWLDSLLGRFDNKGKLSIKMKLNFDVDVWTGIDKETKKPVAKITSTCPYVKTLNISSYKFDAPKERKYNISVFVGYGMSKTGLTPIVGLGIGRTIVRF